MTDAKQIRAAWMEQGLSSKAAGILAREHCEDRTAVRDLGRDYFVCLIGCGAKTLAELDALMGDWDHGRVRRRQKNAAAALAWAAQVERRAARKA